MVGGGGKMAELMLLSEIADPTRFFTDNLLSPEDWGVRSAAVGTEGLWPAVSRKHEGKEGGEGRKRKAGRTRGAVSGRGRRGAGTP